jgi:hypothetical protein
LKIETVLGMLCLCKQPQSRWTRRTNFARTRRVPQEARRAFREKVKRAAGRGRCGLEVWPELHIGTVIKRTVNKHLKEVLRLMTQGSVAHALKLLQASNGGTMLNTSFIECLKGTMRERLAALTRQCRHASSKLQALQTGMYLIGCT